MDRTSRAATNRWRRLDARHRRGSLPTHCIQPSPKAGAPAWMIVRSTWPKALSLHAERETIRVIRALRAPAAVLDAARRPVHPFLPHVLVDALEDVVAIRGALASELLREGEHGIAARCFLRHHAHVVVVRAIAH